MDREEIEQKVGDLELERHGKTIFGLLMLVILVLGVFNPIALSGIPILFAVVSFLGGTTILAGFSALFIALLVNIIYLMYHLSLPVRKLYKKGGTE